MTALRHAALLPLLLFGLVCCSSDAGSDGAGGTTSAAGSAPAGSGAGGMTSVAGSASAGVPGSAGASALGGAAGSSGSTSNGGALATGGQSANGGSAGSAGASGGPGGAASSAGAAGSAGTPSSTLPTGYPAPTADQALKCKSVQPSDGFCPGGGVGPSCLQCLFGGDAFNTSTTATAAATMAAGNYMVTVQLGGATNQTFISAESNRGLLAPVTTAAGQSAQYAFLVNVRANEGQPLQAVPGGYPGLDLFFSGPSAPVVTGIGYSLVTAATKPIVVHVAGDSTVCDQDTTAFGGWAQMIPEFFAPPIDIANYADSGESSSSFYGSAKLWGAIKAHWVPGDWVFIQFGHNDKGVADATVQANLERYVTEALAANVTPIVVSPPARVQFEGGVEGDQSSLHAAAAKAAAAAKKVAYIDLTTLSIAWYNTLGSQAAALKFHANGTDATHTNLAGALKIASLVAGDIKKQNLPLAKYLRP
ncbi:MAG: GDSL-type esterase/lipase family protein [Polyangiaceae bacterium]